jgi:hypothetical protein
MTPSQKIMFDEWAKDTGYFEPKPQWIGLVSPQGHVEYNARFVLGEKAAESLENGKWYTNEELNGFFLKDSSGAVEKNIKKWRCER